MDRIRVNPETRNLSNTEFTQTFNILSKRVGELNKSLVASLQPTLFAYSIIKESINKIIFPLEEMYLNLGTGISILTDTVKDLSFPDLNLYSDNASDDELDVNATNKKVIAEIFQSDSEKIYILKNLRLSPYHQLMIRY